MRQDHSFGAARPLARHCAELTARAVPSAGPATRFPEAGEDLARSLAGPLSGLLGGARLRVTCSAVEPLAPAALRETIGALAANSVLSIPGSASEMLVSITLSDLLAVTDRVFGGEGEVPGTLPAELPLTADLVAAQLEDLLADAVAGSMPAFPRPQIAGRAPDIARLHPFDSLEECRSFALTVSEQGKRDWSIRLALCPDSFARLFAATPKPAAGPSAGRDPLAGPFADLPLEVEAIVAEFTLPLSRLTGLKPGDTIPLALSREIPLKILETTIAYGSVGAADERVALQLTRVF